MALQADARILLENSNVTAQSLNQVSGSTTLLQANSSRLDVTTIQNVVAFILEDSHFSEFSLEFPFESDDQPAATNVRTKSFTCLNSQAKIDTLNVDTVSCQTSDVTASKTDGDIVQLSSQCNWRGLNLTAGQVTVDHSTLSECI